MFIESLLRLAQIVDHFESQGAFLVSKEFHEETRTLIENQNKFLMNELEMIRDNPGPYSFGFGELIITIFSPEEVEEVEWGAIARYKNWQKNYRFNSPMGMVKVLSEIVKDTNGTQQQEGKSES